MCLRNVKYDTLPFGYFYFLQWEYFKGYGEMIWWHLKEPAQIVEKKYVNLSITFSSTIVLILLNGLRNVPLCPFPCITVVYG